MPPSKSYRQLRQGVHRAPTSRLLSGDRRPGEAEGAGISLDQIARALTAAVFALTLGEHAMLRALIAEAGRP